MDYDFNPEERPRRRAASGLLLVLAVLVGWLSLADGPARAMPTTTVSAAIFTYDAPTVARVGVHAFGAVDVSPAQLSVTQEGSATPSVQARSPSTTPASPSVATEAAGGLVDDASFAANTSAKVRGHVFVDKHKLQPLVSKLGSEEAVIKEMLNGVQTSLPKPGFFEIPVQIGGQTVVVRGAVVNGVTRISTAFTP